MPETTGFYELYRDAPIERRDQLRSFRLRHPHQHFTWRGVEWEYIASDALGTEARPTEHWVLKQNHGCTRTDDVVLVLGGATSTAESSFDLILPLEDCFRILSPSYPPVGNISDLLDGLVALMDAVGLDVVHVFGHSLGAGIGHVLVRKYPDRVGKLVLSSFGLYSEKTARKSRLALRLLRRLPYGMVKRYYMRRLTGVLDQSHKAAGMGSDEVAFMTAYLRDLLELQHDRISLMGQFDLLLDLIDNADDYDVRAPIDRPGEVLILQALDDAGFTADEQAALRDTYPGAAVRTFERGGHSVRHANREAYDRALFEFLTG